MSARKNSEKMELAQEDWLYKYLNSHETWEPIVKIGQKILSRYGVSKFLTSGDSLAQLAGISLAERAKRGELNKSVTEPEFIAFVARYLKNKHGNLWQSQSAEKRDARKNVALNDDFASLRFQKILESDLDEMWEWAIGRLEQKISDQKKLNRLKEVLSLRWHDATEPEIQESLNLQRGQVANDKRILRSIFNDLVQEIEYDK